MAISNYTELKAAVANWLGRSDLTTRIPEFITAAEIRLCDDVKVKAMETALAGVIAEGTSNFTYPATAHGLKGDLFYYSPSANLLDYENAFDSWTATNSVVSANAAITDPEEGSAADLWTRSSTAEAHVSQTYTKTEIGKQRFTLSVYVKASVGNYFAMRLAGTGAAKVDAIFNLSTGVAVAPTATTFTEYYSTITDKLMNGWYRVSITAISDAFTSLTAYYGFMSTEEVVDGTDSAANSAGYLYGASLTSYSTRTALEQRPQSECLGTENDETATGTPEWFSLDGSNITVYPIPDDFYPIEGTYYNRLALSDSVATTWFTDNYPMALLYGALIEALVYTEDDSRMYQVLYLEQVQRIKRHENFESAGSRSRQFKQVAI